MKRASLPPDVPGPQPENVLLQASGHAVLTDFDLSFCASSRPFVHMLPLPNGIDSVPILVRRLTSETVD